MSLADRLARIIAKKKGTTAPPQKIDFDNLAPRPRKPEKKKRPDVMGMLLKEVEKKNPRAWVDVKRITNVPIEQSITAAEFDDVQTRWVLAGAQMGGKPFVLKLQQADAVRQWEQHQGVFAKIGVGKGKTFATLMVAQSAFDRGIKKVMLNIPAHVYAQLTRKDIPQARKLLKFTMPVMGLGDSTPTRRMRIAKSGKVGLYIYPYSLMSGKNAHDEMWAINPGLIISDESQKISNVRSARGRRYRKLCMENQPRVVVLSGTITKSSVKEYNHLASLSLRENSFLPHSPMTASEWAKVIDSKGYVDDHSATGPLRPLIDWAVEHFPDEPIRMDVAGFRKAFRLRLEHTPGVVSSGDDDLGTSLTMSNRPVESPEAHPGWEDLQKLMHQVTDSWLTPNGDEIEHAIHTYKWLFELTAGFYNNLVWPVAKDLAERRGITEPEAEVLLERALELHEARQDYSRELRSWLGIHHIPNMDTPFLVGSEMYQHGSRIVGPDLYEAWSDWQELKDDELPERDSYPVRVCGYKVWDALQWALDAKKGIIWYQHKEMGVWLTEVLEQSGLDPLFCPAGRKHNATIIESNDRLVVASMTAHGVGKNLQFHQNQYFLQWKKSAADSEQCLGRLHRMGQSAAELTARTNHTTEWDHANFGACLTCSCYIHQTMQNQKLMEATFDPVPKVLPWEVLKERGFQPEELPPEMREMMSDKFD